MTPGVAPVAHSHARDLRALCALLDDERLTDAQREDFEDMKERLVAERSRPLTDRQRQYVFGVVERLDLLCDVDPPAPLTPVQQARAAQLGRAPWMPTADAPPPKPPGRA